MTATRTCGSTASERALERRLGQAGEVGAHLVHRRVAEHVACRHAEQVALLPPLQRPLLLVAVARATRSRRSALATRSSRSSVRSRLGSGSRSIRSGLARSTSPSWRLVPSRSARWRAASGESPERGGQRSAAPLARREPAQAEQAEVGIRRRRQPVEEERQELLHHP